MIKRVPTSNETDGAIGSTMSSRRHVGALTNDIIDPGLGHDYTILIPQTIVMRRSGTRQQLRIVDEVHPTDCIIIQVVLPPA